MFFFFPFDLQLVMIEPWARGVLADLQLVTPKNELCKAQPAQLG
jgi:hypothetical protein